MSASLQKALLASAFCVWALALAHGARACEPDRVDARVAVAQVFDGDTVRLADGRHLRFIGLDTPEMGRDGDPPQPLAEAATQALRGLLAQGGGELLLRMDAEPRDRHRRLLAHPFLTDGRSLTAELLRRGLATVLVVPPNGWNLECYLAAEREARAHGRGLWALPEYRPVEAAELSRSARGFRLVRGRIARVGHSRYAVWINLAGGVVGKIAREDLPSFQGLDLDRLEGRRVELRGKVYAHERELRIRLRHPYALRPLD